MTDCKDCKWGKTIKATKDKPHVVETAGAVYKQYGTVTNCMLDKIEGLTFIDGEMICSQYEGKKDTSIEFPNDTTCSLQ